MTTTQTPVPVQIDFVGVFSNGKSITNHSLQNLSEVPDIEYIVKVEQPGSSITKFTLINPDGKLRLLRVGDFEIRDIGEMYWPGRATVSLYDYQESDIKQFSIETNRVPATMVTELLSLLKNLDEAGSYNVYLKLTRINELEKKVESLNEENQKLKVEIQTLKASQNSIP